MELSNIANEFVGSTAFSILMLLAVIGLGVFLRLTFRVPESKEYKYRRED